MRSFGSGSASHKALNAYARGEDFEEATAAWDRGDYSAALPVFRAYAALGDPAGAHNLGFMYETGRGVPKDGRLAAVWYWRAAEQGLPAAQAALGWLYHSGNGVPQDHTEALKWYRKAASQGGARGMANLGMLYGKGEGVPQDYVRAYMWSNLAAAAGAGGDAVSNRSTAARLMTADQVAEAQRLARECLASNYQRCGEPGQQAPTPRRR
jgi:TPR repeat protein